MNRFTWGIGSIWLAGIALSVAASVDGRGLNRVATQRHLLLAFAATLACVLAATWFLVYGFLLGRGRARLGAGVRWAARLGALVAIALSVAVVAAIGLFSLRTGIGGAHGALAWCVPVAHALALASNLRFATLLGRAT